MTSEQEVEFPVYWSKPTAYVFSLPSSLRLSETRHNSPVRIHIVFRDGTAPKIAKIDSEWPIEAWRELDSNGRVRNVEITFGTPEKLPLKKFSVKIHFADETAPYVLSGIGT